MKVWYRLLSAFLALVLLCVCLGLAWTMLRWPYPIDLTETVNQLRTTDAGLWSAAVALPILILLCGAVIFCRATKRIPPPPTSTVIQKNEIGTVVITLTALDGMVQRHIRSNQRIKDCETQIATVTDGVTINVKLAVMPDTPLVELCAELQRSLKSFVQDNSGVDVMDISVLVANAGTVPSLHKGE